MEYKQYQVVFRVEGGEETVIFAAFGESLLEAAKKANVAIDAPCSGMGTCGKCRVKLLSGEVEAEGNRHISWGEYAEGYRLACASRVISELHVLIPQAARTYQDRIKVSGKGAIRERRIFKMLQDELQAMGFWKDSGLELVKVHLKKPDLDDPMADRERLLRALAEQRGGSSPGLSLYALSKLPGVLREADFSCTCVIRREADKRDTVLNIFPAPVPGAPVSGAGAEPVTAGFAIDIGTTTVSILMVDLQTGELLTSGSAGNGQIRYGADVISRIIESARPGGLERMRTGILAECIEPLVQRMCGLTGISPDNIYRVAVAANTTMTHFFMGVPAEHLRLEPYVPAFFETGPFRAVDLGLSVHPAAEVVIAPGIGSYVGGDISAGIFSSMIFKKESLSLFIDLGTNGELALGNSQFLMACACSAGPAFEGGDISCGMRATDGAIEACHVNTDSMEPAIIVIGEIGQKPVGLCGSGLIDLIGELFRCGIINARGKIIREGKRIYRDEWGIPSYVVVFAEDSENGRAISLSEADIDNFIRAKGAIFSAIRTMLAVLDLPVEAIDNVYVAGGIGGGINMKNAIRIGMFPNLGVKKYHYIGNSSMLGAYAMLSSRRACAMVGDISRGMTYLELSSHPGYMDEFVAACFLPHTDGALFKEHE
ncbi:MAG: ASKHA domain-containing protein [Treponema sp.]|jgi:uncharacterized 2Fe-2S/4Fe-4S cluster protein (DUF4445 family)|nr:ASKHA domain-containing protein [Treponema sp.]